MKSSGSGKKSDKSATTIGDFFPSKKSTKNKRNKDEKERSGKKLKKNESALKTCPIGTKDFHWTLIDAHASECVGGGDFDLDDFDAFEKTKKSSFSRSSKEEDKEEEDQTFMAKTGLNLGRSAMLGFAATTFLDVSTNGLGPIEQLIGEEKSLVTHVVNPLNLAKDVLEVTGLYVESIILVWVFLSGVFLLAVTSGLRKPSTSTMSGMSRPNGENRVDAMAGIVKSAWREQVRENKKYEIFNGRLAMLGITASFIGDYFLCRLH